MFTHVKAQLADVGSTQEFHNSHVELNITLPRFDKVLHSIHADRVRRNNYSEVKMAPNANRRVKSYFESSDFKIGSKHRDLTPDKLKFNYMTEGSPNVSPKNLKQKFFAGDKEAVMYQDPKEPKVSSYLAHHKGLKIGTG